MKNLLLIFSLLLAFCINVDAQKALKKGGAIDTDTIALVSATTTAYVYPGSETISGMTTFEELGVLDATFYIDSLSGGASGASSPIFTIQYCYNADCTKTRDISSVTVNGTTQQVLSVKDTDFTALGIRGKLYCPSATESIKLSGGYGWRKRI